MLLLTIVLGILFVILWWSDFQKVYRSYPNFPSFRKSYKFRETLYFLLIISLPIAFIEYSGLGNSLKISDGVLLSASLILSFSISLMWFLYLDRIDLFEREPRMIIIITFILGALFTFLVYPLSNFIDSSFDFRLNGELWNDWWYCVFGIGMVEEIVKIIPFFIVLRFSKHINEPFDYILYGSVSALGFAFTENVLYLQSSQLSAVYGRAMFSSVAHMFDTSIITYGLIYLKHEKIDLKGFEFPILLLIASLAHGFYDFWLINDAASSYYFFTILFFLFSIYLWVTMSNNMLNISPFYKTLNNFNPNRLKYRIVNMLLTIFYATYVFYFLFYGSGAAYRLLFNSWQLNVFILLFLAFNLSSLEFIKGNIGMVKFKNAFLFLLPRIHVYKDYSNCSVSLDIPSTMHMRTGKDKYRSMFPLSGKLIRRISYRGNTECYLLKVRESISSQFLHSDYFILKLISKEEESLSSKPNPMVFYGLKKLTAVESGVIPDKRIVFIHEVVGIEIERERI